MIGDLDMQRHDDNAETGRPGPVTWRKSTASNPNGDCVETAALVDGQVAVRNSRDPRGPLLVYTRIRFATFVQDIKDGAFDGLIS